MPPFLPLSVLDLDVRYSYSKLDISIFKLKITINFKLDITILKLVISTFKLAILILKVTFLKDTRF